MAGTGAEYPSGRPDRFDDEAFVVGDGVVADLGFERLVVAELRQDALRGRSYRGNIGGTGDAIVAARADAGEGMVANLEAGAVARRQDIGAVAAPLIDDDRRFRPGVGEGGRGLR